MSTTEYKVYEAAVSRFLETNQVKAGCHGPIYDEAGNAPEPFFSWQACECCRRPLGGNRERYRFATETGDGFEANICADCVYYLAEGQLDDLTMLDMH